MPWLPRSGPFRALWLRWKKLKLPWRRMWLCGEDLSGTTFWEFRDSLSSQRVRRIAQYPSGTHHADVTFAPAWIQWLRHTRPVAPTILEQQLELQRQDGLKVLAAAANERWENKESYLESPKVRDDQAQRTDHMPTSQPRVQGNDSSLHDAFGSKESTNQPNSSSQPPWHQKHGGPGEQWQPQHWTPTEASRRP